MPLISTLLPDFVTEVAEALRHEGLDALAEQLQHVEVERITYEARDDAGYIYFKRPPVSLHFAKLSHPVARTVVCDDGRFNVDIDHDGSLFGIELLGRGDVMIKLLAEHAP
jgi:uncharacterized protein YuzE